MNVCFQASPTRRCVTRCQDSARSPQLAQPQFQSNLMSTRPKPLERQLSWFSSAAGFLNTDRVASAGLRPGLIVALFYFDRPLKLQALREAIRERLLPLPRFSQRMVDDGKDMWLVDVEVDLTHHVCEVEQTAAWSDAQFNEWVASRQLG